MDQAGLRLQVGFRLPLHISFCSPGCKGHGCLEHVLSMADHRGTRRLRRNRDGSQLRTGTGHTTYPCFRGQTSHLTQFLTSEVEKHMPPAVAAGTVKSHGEGRGCVILTQGGSQDSEQQRRHHWSSHWGTPFLMSAAG